MLGWYHRDHLVDPATFSGHVGFSWQQLSPCPVWQAFASLTLWSGRTRQQQTSWLLSFTSSPMHFACGASAAIVCHPVIGYVIVEVASLSGGYEMIWKMNVGSVRAEMWDSNQIHSKGGSVKSQWVDINVLYFCYYTRYLMLLHVDFLFWKDRLMRDMRKEHHWVLPPHTVVSHYSPLGMSKVSAFTDVYHCLPYFPYRLCSRLLER